MLKFRIHWKAGGVRDSIVISGDTIEDIREKAREIQKARGLNTYDNQMWSERV